MKKVRLLTVDDDKFIRNLVNKTLRTEFSSFEITEADNGRKGQALLQRHSFDLVLCDWEMPEMTGLQLLQWVRSEEALKNQPFVLLTSLDKKENVVRALEAGVSDYITKPFTSEHLLKKVTQQLVKSGCLTEQEVNELGRSRERIGAAGGAEILASATLVSASKVKPKAPPLPKKALLLQGEQRAAAVVRDLNRREALVQIKRTELFPALASPIQVGLIGGTEAAPLKVSLKGYISSLQLAERNPATENIFVRVQFFKQDPEAAEIFEHFFQPAP